MRRRRQAAQPSGIKTFGSTFKNPDDPQAQGRTAGQLLDEAGCRGLRIGGASFSAKHANFVENHGEATTADVVDADGRRPAPGQGAVRDRARGRGSSARAGGSAAQLGYGMIAQGRLGRLRGGARPVSKRVAKRPRRRWLPSPRVVIAIVAVLALFGGAWAWLRDSSLVSVDRVTVTGVTGPDASRSGRC